VAKPDLAIQSIDRFVVEHPANVGIEGDSAMLRARQVLKRKRRSKAVPALGAAGLSLTLASGASAATGGPVGDMLTHSTAAGHEITLREEEVTDVSLATFYVFDKESGAGKRLAWGCGGCVFACAAGQAGSESNTYSPPAPGPIRPPHKPIRNKR
jgi:hypothetical protein